MMKTPIEGKLSKSTKVQTNSNKHKKNQKSKQNLRQNHLNLILLGRLQPAKLKSYPLSTNKGKMCFKNFI